MNRFQPSVLLFLLIASLFSGCSIEKIVIRRTAPIILYTFNSINEEEDLEIAEKAAASDLKLLEGLLKGDPENKQMLLMAVKAFTGYSLAFVEQKSPERARRFYLRARDYGIKLLDQKLDFSGALKSGERELNRILLKYTEKDVPALFWTANAWAGWINLSLDSPFALADLPKVEIIMRRVLDLGEDYFYGGVHIFYGVYYGGRPVLTGGDPERAKEHFERNLEISRGKFLMTYVYYARYYAVPVQDRVLFQELLGKVIESPVNILPEQALINGVARLRAQEMLKNIDKYFFREEK